MDKIQARCQTLVDEIGGTTVPLHHWENIIPPTPTEPDTNAIAIGFAATLIVRLKWRFERRLAPFQRIIAKAMRTRPHNFDFAVGQTENESSIRCRAEIARGVWARSNCRILAPIR